MSATGRDPRAFLAQLVSLAGLPPSAADTVEITGSDPVFPSRFRFVAPGAAVIAAAGLGAAELWALKTGRRQQVRLHARAAAAALKSPRYLRINGKLAREDSPDDVTGFYQLRDGRWMYLHCNFFNVRDNNAKVLGVPPVKAAFAKAVAEREGLELEEALFAAGGVGALVRSEAEWLAVPQQKFVADAPLFEIMKIGEAPPRPLPKGDRPLSGIRVLDLTRVLAGPACARSLAEHGADVMRVTREDLADSGLTDFDTSIGKLNTHIDLRDPAQADILRGLARESDVFLQGYRPGALAQRGFSPEALAGMRPGIVYVTLSAWGHDGPWKLRRGYDTVVQSMNGMAFRPAFERPAFLPVSPHDYIAGYVLAFGAMAALARRAQEGGSWLVRTSLAGAGHWFRQAGLNEPSEIAGLPADLPVEEVQSLMAEHDSPIGRISHLAPAVQMSETPPRWARPSVPRGHHPPVWPDLDSR